MRTILYSEISKERFNAAALGMFNSAISSGMTTSESNQDSETSKVAKFIDEIEKENIQRIKEIKADTEYLNDNRAMLFKPEINLLERSLESNRDMLKINQDRVKSLKKKFKL